MTEEQIEEAVAALLAEPPPPKGRGASGGADELRDDHIAQKMVELNRITQYQADQLLNGRTRFNLGKYVITDFIGRGGMGDVFKGEHEMMGREVAIKVLTRHRSTPEAEENFQREIRLQAKLDHPNLVRAYDAGHDGNVYYLVVEYVPGTDLRRLVRTQGKLDMQQAATVIMHAAKGLHHAHRQGLIHRDVKPGNLLVTPQGLTKVSDLGLAGFMDEGQNDPRAGKIVGTADYISPEVFKSPGNVTPASDIYSLGCTLYYAVTGKVPYPGGSTREKLERHCHGTPLHPHRFNESVTEEFVEVIADMMEKDPDKRIPSAAEVASRLAVWARGEGPLPAHMRTSSSWAPPPLPAGAEEIEDTDEFEATAFEISAAESSAHSAAGQQVAGHNSQGTSPLSGQETTGSGTLPPPHAESGGTQPPAFSMWTYVMIAAGVIVPVALCLGAAAMYILLRILGAD